jgi:hypothetical protein
MSTIDEIYLIHHCHTDIGYTHDQPTLWDLQRRFVDDAMDAVEQDADLDEPHAFKWTAETTAPLLTWLETATDEQLERFARLEEQGRIEVTGMLANITPLYGPSESIESLRPVRYLREEHGFDVRYAMNCDVNGQNWTLVDDLLDAGIEGFTMGINEHSGGSPPTRPDLFLWEGPSGRRLPTLNGFHYSTGFKLGIGHDAEALAEEWWPMVEERVAESGYPLDALHVQSFHPFGDNGTAYREFGDFIAEWNERDDVQAGELPSIRMATPSEWWEHVHDNRDELPVKRGDWTDFWNYGAASSAREVGVNKENVRRLETADAVEAGLTCLGAGREDRDPTRRSAPGTRQEAWWNAVFFDEHTWGADASIGTPHDEDVRSQWNHKANYAYEARSGSQMLQRDAVAELARRAADEEGER